MAKKILGGPPVQYSIDATIRNIICPQQHVSGYELTATRYELTATRYEYGILMSSLAGPRRGNCCKVASWSELVCTGSKIISRSSI